MNEYDCKISPMYQVLEKDQRDDIKYFLAKWKAKIVIEPEIETSWVEHEKNKENK